MTIENSPDIPAEVNFVSERPATVSPQRVEALSTSTVRADSSLLCTNGTGGTPRYNEWRARVTLTDVSDAVLTVATAGPLLRVELP